MQSFLAKECHNSHSSHNLAFPVRTRLTCSSAVQYPLGLVYHVLDLATDGNVVIILGVVEHAHLKVVQSQAGLLVPVQCPGGSPNREFLLCRSTVSVTFVTKEGSNTTYQFSLNPGNVPEPRQSLFKEAKDLGRRRALADLAGKLVHHAK